MANEKSSVSAPVIVKLNSTEMVEAGKAAVLSGEPFILLGSPGGGKTSILRYIASILGMEYRQTPPLPTLDPTDLRGIPYLKDGRTEWAVPEFLPIESPAGTDKCDKCGSHHGKGLVTFDDFPTGAPAVQAAFYQLFQERCIGNYTLPCGWSMAATGNYDGDRAATHRIPTPNKSRWITFHLTTNFEAWQAVATLIGIRAEVRGFLAWRPGALNDFEKQRDNHSYPCERSWEKLSNAMNGIDAAGGVSQNVEHSIYAGCVGIGAATEFLSYLKYHRSIPTIESILADPKKAPVPKNEPAALWAISAALSERIDKKNIKNALEYLARIPNEFAVFCIRDVMRRDPSLTQTSSFIQWASDNAKMVL